MPLTTLTHNNTFNNCFFCNGNHVSKECILQVKMSPILKNKIGYGMEHYIANKLNCLYCGCHTLIVIGNHSPSVDIVCKNCYNLYEVKSKCLSVNKLPNDISLNHGLYNDYLKRVNDGLNLIIVIYGVNRQKKNVYIREIIFIENNDLKNNNLINVTKINNSKLSTIYIYNKNIFSRKIFHHNEYIFSFDEDITLYKELNNG